MATDEIVLTLEEALAPHLVRAAARRRDAGLGSRLAVLITADDPSEGVAAWGRRLLDWWIEDIEDRVPSSAVALWDGPVQVAIVEHDRALGGA